ncbi:protein EXECUTER 2, chloroplastic [Rutidosis leptorrhynchoides]|uniref:protein EXECUTER 2, chloroplastic n=1 Tax=Rutidosis leptorrhynchoides TaxID=125765 RepID=UPI003A9A0599
MAVANVYWATGTSITNFPKIRPPLSSSSDVSISKKSFNLKFVSGSNNVMKSSSPVDSGCRCTYSDHATSSDWDWNTWTRHFSEIELAERSVSLLQFQLEEAIEKEDFQEASKLKTAIAEATSKDCVAEVMSELKNAIREERYHDASKLCKDTGSGLVGWWVGYSKDSDDPFGRLIRITPGVGRFIGKSYNPRQLVSASPGTPLFEIFVVKENDETYTMQVVFMQRAKTSNSKSASPSSSSSTKGTSMNDIENSSVIDVKVNEDKPGKNDEKSISFEGATEDGIRSVINFLKDKIPELKIKDLKVMKVDVEGVMENDTVNQILSEDDDKTTSDEDSEEENNDLDDPQPDRIVMGANSDETEDGKNLEMKLFVGGVLHTRDDTPSKDEFVRVPAEIEEMEKDSFVLHVPVKSTEESIASKVKMAAISTQGVSELMPPDVAKALWSSDKVSRKVSRDVREIVKFAVSQAKKREKLSEYTNFTRITTSRGDLDPFDGLYVGAFGPYGTEVVQLKRKYGNWNGANDVEFFEYVEAVKVTGDMNVPAGQVTFRARIAKGGYFSNRGMYPDELGVVASYKGQGRIAEFGFKNPKWVEGELLQLNGKGMGPYVKGADLGFLYVVPEQSFLVLFNRLRLPE